MHVLLINPLSSTRFLSEQLRQNGIKTTTVYALDKANLSTYVIPESNLFDSEVWINTQDINQIIALLGTTAFDYVINGHDQSVHLSDQLANFYTPQFANNLTTYQHRSNKYEMHQTLAKNGLAHIQQKLVGLNSSAAIVKNSLEYPLFIKPLNGAGSNGARRIDNRQQLRQYFKNCHEFFDNIQDLQNNSEEIQFLLSEFVVGEEVLVDTFSVQGIHYISSIQKYFKTYINDIPVTLGCELIPETDVLYSRIAEYVCNCLTITGFENGFAHTELFIKESQPILIEINPRISGAYGMHNLLALTSGRESQVDLLINSIFKLQTLKTNHGYKYNHLFFIYATNFEVMPNLSSLISLQIKSAAVYSIIKQLEPTGSKLTANICSLDYVKGFAILSSDDMQSLKLMTEKLGKIFERQL